jgi:DNA-binding transcriptional MerR regulator
MATSETLNTEEVALRCQVSVETLRAWRRESKGPRWFRLPDARRVLYAAEDVEAFIAAARSAAA